METAFRYRFMAEMQDDTAAWQEANGLDNSKAKDRAKALRIQADLIEQGVPTPSEHMTACQSQSCKCD